MGRPGVETAIVTSPVGSLRSAPISGVGARGTPATVVAIGALATAALAAVLGPTVSVTADMVPPSGFADGLSATSVGWAAAACTI